MKRVLLDSNAIDPIADTPGLLAACQEAGHQGLVTFLKIHVVEDELTTAPEPRRTLLLSTYRALLGASISTPGFVLGESRLGLAMFGDDRDHQVIRSVRGGGDHPMRDALIGSTADGEADVFVTCEKDFRKRMTRLGVSCESWSMEDLKAYVGFAP